MNAAEVYLSRVTELLEQLQATQGDAIERGADSIADAWERGGRVLVATTSHALHDEALRRAGGPVAVDMLQETAAEPTWNDPSPVPLGDYDIDGLPNLRPGDVVLVPTNCGTTKRAVGIGIAAKEAGGPVIALTQLPYETSPSVVAWHASGKKLHEVADITIDLGGEAGDGIVPIPGSDVKASPTSLVVGGVAMWMLFARAAEKLTERGKVPYLMKSIQLGDGALERNRELFRRWEESGYAFDEVQERDRC